MCIRLEKLAHHHGLYDCDILAESSAIKAVGLNSHVPQPQNFNIPVSCDLLHFGVESPNILVLVVVLHLQMARCCWSDPEQWGLSLGRVCVDEKLIKHLCGHRSRPRLCQREDDRDWLVDRLRSLR